MKLQSEARVYLSRLVMRPAPEDGMLVLIGSWARGVRDDSTSDVDIVQLNGEPVCDVPSYIQMIYLSDDSLRRRVLEGDDFPQWVLRFGVPLTRRHQWNRLQQLVLDVGWPSIERKWHQAKRRLEVAEELLDMGDVDAARQELLCTWHLTARLLLLSCKVFPLSRPELAAQLRRFGRDAFAAIPRTLAETNSLTRPPLQATSRLLQDVQCEAEVRTG